MSINVKEQYNVNLSRWTSAFTDSVSATQNKGTLRLTTTANGGQFDNSYLLTGYGVTGRDVSSVRILVIANSKASNPSTIGVGFYQKQTVGGNGFFQMYGGMSLYQNDSLNTIFQQQNQPNGVPGKDVTASAPLGPYSAGDLFEIILTSVRTTYTTTITNLTKGQAPVSVTATVDQPFTSPDTERVFSNYGIFIPNGDFNILSYNVGNVLQDATMGFIGDSIVKGFAAGPFQDSFTGILITRTLSDIVLEPGDAANTTDGITVTPELNTYPNLQYAFIMIGGNDPLFGISQATSFANYNTIVTNLKSTGKTIVHLLTLPRSTGQEAWIVTLNAHIKATYTKDIIVDTWTPLKDPNSNGINALYTVDGLHPNALGHAITAQTIQNQLIELFPIFP